MPLTDTQIRSAKPGLKPVKPKKGSDDRVVFVATTKPFKLYYIRLGVFFGCLGIWTVPSSRLGSGALVGQAEVG